jgi:hypothetical protein
MEINSDFTDELLMKVNEYITTTIFSGTAGPGTGTGTHIGTGIRGDPLAISIDSDGFPKAPDLSKLDKPTKAQLEKVYRSYMKLHYSTYDHYMPVIYIDPFSRPCSRKERPTGSIYTNS